MKIIKTPTGIITIDETTKKLTQAEYDALDNKKDSIYLITDSSKNNIVGLYKDGIPINNFPASKIALIPSGTLTKTNVQEAIAENDSHITTIKNNLSSHTSNTSNPHRVTKSQVGLGNVDNTSDINKPVSTAQQSAINDAKKSVNNSLNSHTSNTTVHITAAERTKWNDKSDITNINNKIGASDISGVGTTITGAISSLATIIGVGNSSSGGTTLTGDIFTLKSNLSSHINNTTVHITAAERTTWNSKAAGNHTHNSIKDSNDGNTITITYSKAGQLSTSWLASWNGRELGAISPSKITAGSLNYFQNTSNVNMGQDTSTSNGIGYVNDYSGTKLTENVADGALYRQAYSDRWVHEIYGDYRTGQIAVRGKNNGTWQSWRTILDSNNYSSYAATKNHTHSAATQSANGLMSATDKKKLDEMFGIITITKSLKLTTAWMDTGIAGGDLDSGTYVLQVSGFTYTNNNELYSEVWSGVMTWYKYGTNSSNSDEIILHNAGYADNSNEIYLRTKRNPNDSSGKNGTLSLQIAAKINAKAAENITFKFRRLI